MTQILPKYFESYVEKVRTRMPSLQKDYADSLGKRVYDSAIPHPTESIIRGYKAERFITKQTKILTFGSCFAQEIRKWLRSNEFNVEDDLWGVLYNVKTFQQMVEAAFENRDLFAIDPFYKTDRGYSFPYLKSSDHKSGILMGETHQEACNKLQALLSQSHQTLKSTDLIIFTLGMTECWRSNSTNHVYYTNPAFWNKKESEKFIENAYFYNLSVLEVVDSLKKSFDTLKRKNKDLNFIISVSPVPLLMTYREDVGAYIANLYSKSVNLAAAFTFCESRSDTHYMPAYEIVTADPPKSFSDVDGRHVTKSKVQDVIRGFNTSLSVKVTYAILKPFDDYVALDNLRI